MRRSTRAAAAGAAARALGALAVLAVACGVPRASALDPFELETACAADERHDTASLACVACGDGKEAAPGGESCRCEAGGLRVQDPESNDVTLFSCGSCAGAGETSSRDGLRCMTCGASTVGGAPDAAAGDCVCATEDGPGHVLVERDAAGGELAAKECVACPPHARVFPDADRYACVACPHEAQTMDADGACECGANYTAAGDSCVLSEHVSGAGTIAGTVQFRDLRGSDSDSSSTQTFVSQPFASTYLRRAVDCGEFRSREACHALLNMCALEKSSADRTPCQKFNELAEGIEAVTRGFPGWKDGMPWLRYEDASTLESEVLQTRYALSRVTLDLEEFSRSSQLVYFLAKYAFNGTFLGVERLSTQLQLCGGDQARMEDFLRFGVTYKSSCTLDVASLAALPEPVFYDMYALDSGGLVFPVPVKVTNYRGRDGDRPSDTVLHRRFFVYDTISSKPLADAEAAVFVYAKSVKLRVRMQVGSQERVFPPLLTIEYGEREGGTGTSRVTFRGEYTKDLDGLWLASTVLLALGLVLVAILWFRRMYYWIRCNSLAVVDCSFLVVAAVFALGVAADVFFWLAFVITSYCWIFYKGQETAFFLLPEADGREVYLLTVFVVLSLFGKFFDVCYRLWVQIHTDVFFIDWEKPRGVMPQVGGPGAGFGDASAAGGAGSRDGAPRPPDSPRSSSGGRVSGAGRPAGAGGAGGNLGSGGGAGGAGDDADDDEDRRSDSGEQQTPVSVWRRLFISNKWSALQVERDVNVPATLFVLLLFLRGIGLEFLATSQPDAGNVDGDAAPVHPLLLFAVTTFFWLVLAGGQLLFRALVYNRYVEDKAAEFVDLLSMTNISCLVLDQRYHGYYIHGKTVHAHADVSLEEMNAQIASERRRWTMSRGLVDGKDTFEVFPSRQFRAHYDKIYTVLLSNEMMRQQHDRRARSLARGLDGGGGGGGREAAQAAGGGGGGGGKGGGNEAETAILMSDRLMAASETLNEFLKAFVEKRDPSYPWQEGVKTFFERRFEWPPRALLFDSNATMFYDDPAYEFKRVFLMGIEHDLTLLLILWYSSMDLAFGNTFVSILMTYLLNRAVHAVRYHWGKINLSRKTLIDYRFLT